jgi:hypothetical protein
MSQGQASIGQLIQNSPYEEPSKYWSYDRNSRLFKRLVFDDQTATGVGASDARTVGAAAGADAGSRCEQAPAFVAELFANPVGLAALAVATSGFDPHVVLAALSIAGIKLLADRFVIARTRGTPMAWRHLLAAPLKDLLLLGILPYAAVSRSVEWRGVRLRMGWGTALRADDGPLPIRWSRRARQSLFPSSR